MTEIRAAEMSFQQLNEQIHACQDAEITLTDVMGQRYIASGLSGKRLAIHGIPGNALGAYVHSCRLQYIEFFGKFSSNKFTCRCNLVCRLLNFIRKYT